MLDVEHPFVRDIFSIPSAGIEGCFVFCFFVRSFFWLALVPLVYALYTPWGPCSFFWF